MTTRPVAQWGRWPIWYQILVDGKVDQRATESTEGLIIESTGDQTVLHVEIVNQAKLYDILNWLHEQGVDLVRLHPTASEPFR